MPWLRPLFVVALLLLPGIVSALDMTAWKGETANAFLPDGESVAAAKDEFEVKVGALKGVAYSQAPSAIEVQFLPLLRQQWHVQQECRDK